METLLLLGLFGLVAAMVSSSQEEERKREAQRTKTLADLPQPVKDVVTAAQAAGKDQCHVTKTTTYEGPGLKVDVRDRQDVKVTKLP